MDVVVNKKRENLYQVACLRLFESTHKGCVADNVGNHPNAYFTSSRQYTKDFNKKKAPTDSVSKNVDMAAEPAEGDKKPWLCFN